MSSDDEDLAFYGTPLDPIEEDAIPSKKPTPIEEQEVRDKYGRRRFHGAFTGGFSAGYFNSVGSEEGWTPSAFKSSRSEKATSQFQKPEDFMDDEDTGEFGIAPKVLRATSDYKQSSSRKRHLMNLSTGPIPGQPVLRDILQPAKETVGVRLLRSMGWRPGQGVGPRLNHQQKKTQQREIRKASKKVYGCQLLPQNTSANSENDSSDESDSELKSITFAPDDYEAFIVKTKDDVFGIGYKGLDKRPVLSKHVQLFEPSYLGMQEKKKKVAIWGQAFGVGALEEDDEDIYSRDDMSQYDFALESSSMIAQRKKEERALEKRGHLALTAPREAGAPLEGFILGKNKPNSQRKFFRPPDLPPGFKAFHETRTSRWDVNSKGEKENVAKKQGLGRHDLDARVRGSILDEPLPKPAAPPTSDVRPPVPQVLSTSLAQSPLMASSDTIPLAGTSSFRPFISQPEKQARYERFLELTKYGQRDLLPTIQPASMTEWDKEHERSEFEQAARLYKPLSGIMNDRFVSASQSDDSLNPLIPVEKMKHGNEEMRNAAKMKLFGKLTRTRGSWQPCALLCKRFNVPQPSCLPEMTQPGQRPSSFSVFDYLEASSHNTSVEVQHVEKEDASDCIPTVAEHPSSSQAKQDKPEDDLNEGPEATKKVHNISDTLARLLADDTGKEQPEPEEKPDLFKAIFLSSSEDSESDSEDDTGSQANTALAKNISKEDLVAPRNLSPPRGIFANLDLDALNTRPSEKQEEKTTVSERETGEIHHSLIKDDAQGDDMMYGPRLPTATPKMNVPSSSDTFKSHRKSESALWVERKVKSENTIASSDSDDSSSSGSDKKKLSKKKKHKKEKKKKKDKRHKKHKSKHKRKS
ncbi:G patch domain-containing protein 1 homolog [Thrips palmi]|uniref:G patch domain-containing protein 1 homolog n=1 Tax=Thrips palmi TaxID=161013 RepID=A0A6P8ZVZ5_THRPL|nr:G patch domain-containing protein 1 homolog [Thrips palmi]